MSFIFSNAVDFMVKYVVISGIIVIHTHTRIFGVASFMFSC